jgi:hypothetical protein
MHQVSTRQWPLFGLFFLIQAIASLTPGPPPVEVPFTGFPSVQLSVAEKPGPIKGWNAMRWYPEEQYEYGISDELFKDQKCAFIRSATDKPGAPYVYGQLSQMFKAKNYRNKRMRFSAVIKSDMIDMSAALLMMVQGTNRQLLSYDDMYGRNITGTREWERHKVVLDIPEESDFIDFGVRVRGKGEVWISSITFEETEDEPTADPIYANEPRNLDFSK